MRLGRLTPALTYDNRTSRGKFGLQVAASAWRFSSTRKHAKHSVRDRSTAGSSSLGREPWRALRSRQPAHITVPRTCSAAAARRAAARWLAGERFIIVTRA
jgi:hypothetical protein